MSDTPGIPAIRHSADGKYLVVVPGVESDDWKYDNPVNDESAAALLALQAGTNRFVTRGASGVGAALANEGGGTGLVYDTTTAGTSYLRSLVADTAAGREGIEIATVGQEIVVGASLTGANVGPPPGPTIARVFSQKNAAAQLEFRELIAGMNVTLTEGPSSITIDAAPGGGGVSGLANEGGGAGVYDTMLGSTALLRSLLGTANGVTVTQNATTLTIDNTLTGANLGAGAQVFAAKAGAALQFRSLAAALSSGLALAQNAGDITISAASGSVVTALANEGAGPGLVFDAVVGNTANLRSLQADPAPGSGGLSVATAGTVVNIGNTLTGANLGAGAQVFAAKAGAALQFRSLAAALSSGLALTQNAGDVTISAASGSVVTSLANEGAGTGLVFDAVVGNTANLRSLQADPAPGSSGLSVATAGTVVNIGNTLTGANLGGGAQVFSAKSGAALQFRSLIAAPSSGLALTQNAGDVTISAAAGATITALANEGAGTGLVFDAIVGNTANLRSLQADPAPGSGGLSVATAGTVVNIGNTLTGANLGGGAQVFAAKSGAALQFRSILAGPNVTVTQNANDITISAAGSGPGGYTRTPVNVASYAVLPSDDVLAVLYTPTGSVTLTLPTIVSLGAPKKYTIVDEGGKAAVHPITVAAGPGNTIIGAPSVVLSGNYNSISIYHNSASGWFIASV